MPADKTAFIRALAKYLTANQAAMSIKLQLRSPEALAWATLRHTTPLFGYPSFEEAEKQLREWLL